MKRKKEVKKSKQIKEKAFAGKCPVAVEYVLTQCVY